ncbi:MAG: LuxR family transcriptional regulator, partial [Gammaproteobacteria bacterium]|nr:LuxR family transcriptional regulator [Gammaproteobacteria bacterium]
ARVQRPGLIEHLNDGLDRKLTLLSAPAGFGKTTLVSHWVEKLQEGADGESIKAAWLSLDEDDNDPVRFLTYYIAALNQIKVDIGQGALSMLQSPQPPSPNSVLISLINELATIPDKIIFVLDDYHLIEAKPIHQALVFFLENLPPKFHLVIATRQDPPLSLGRLRARNQITELRAADLRFTASEASDFLNQVMGLNLSSDDIAELETRTEGWIAGLQLAAISMRGRQDHAGFIKSFTGGHRLVLDFLIEEVLGQQPENIQNFLLQTSVLDRMTGSLCDALTGQENGQETLEMLDHANLFVFPMDEERRWYRYHHLFADLLRQRLHQIQPEYFPILQIKAGEWFKNQGFNREAIKHLLIGKEYQSAAELIRSVAIEIIQQGEHTTVGGWINSLPGEFVKAQPYLCVLHARALQLTGQLEASEALLIDAENALDSQNYHVDETDRSVRGLVHSCRAYSSFMIGDHDHTISYAKKALDQLPESEKVIKTQTALYLGIAYRYTGQLRAAMEVYNEILPTTQSIGGNSIAVLCYMHLADLYVDMAQLNQAKKLYEGALNFAEESIGRPDVLFTGYVYVSIGRILRQWNQLEDAYRVTVKGLDLCREWNVADILALSCFELAYLHQALGNHMQARALINEAGNIFNSLSQWAGKLAAAHQIKFDLAFGDIESAENWAQTNDLDIDGDFEFHREIEYLTLARVFIVQERFEEALSLTERICQIAEEIGKSQTELEGLILLALVLSAQEKTGRALGYLERAISIGEPEGYIRIFVDEGPPMAQLLYEALSRGIAPEYVQRLLAAFPDAEQEEVGTTKAQVDQSGLIEPLSEREIEVLQLIAMGLTNQVVAARLVLSPHTVKAHTRNIYSKLAVNNRTQAVDRARTLGILPPD